jgi:flagellar hook-length control protein FliK
LKEDSSLKNNSVVDSYADEKKDLNVNKAGIDNADFALEINKASENQNLKMASKTGIIEHEEFLSANKSSEEKTSLLTADGTETKTAKEIIETVNALDAEKNNAVKYLNLEAINLNSENFAAKSSSGENAVGHIDKNDVAESYDAAKYLNNGSENEVVKPINQSNEISLDAVKSLNSENAAKSLNENNSSGYNDNKDDKSYTSNQDKDNLDKGVNVSVNNDLDKDATANRLEFDDFMHKIFEQRALLNVDPSKNPSRPQSQQMNLANKGRLAFSEGVENVIRFVRAGAVSKAVLIIDPPSLGRVNIEIVSTDNGIEAVLKVSSEQVRMLVQDQAAQLKQNLEQAGVKLTEFSVDVQQDGSRSNNQTFRYKPRKSAHFGSAENENENEADRIEAFRVDLRKGLLHWIA